MLTDQAEELLASLLMKMIQGENRVERCRKSLCDVYQFDPQQLFRDLSKLYSFELIPREIKDFLIKNSVEGSDQDIYLLVRQYSSNQNGRLNFEDFSHLVLPATNDFLSNLALKRIHTEKIDSRVTYLFLSLLQAELELQHELEELKVSLFKDPQFSLWKAFETLNKSGNGFINEAEFQSFFVAHRKYITKDDFDALMRRIDIEDDLLINYNEFLEGLIPLKVPASHETRGKKLEENKTPKKYSNGTLLERENEIKTQENFSESKNQDKTDSVKDELHSDDLESSPRFKDPKEFTLSARSFETPEKIKGGKSRNLPKKPGVFEKFQNLLTQELEYERKIEFYRQELIMQNNFSVLQLFKIIDKDQKGEVQLYDFEKFLEEIDLEAPREILWIIFKRYGDPQSLTMNFQDFSKIFRCYDEEYANLINLDSEDDLEKETLDKIKNVLEVIIRSEENIEDDRKELASISEDELKEFYQVLDCDEDGEVSVEDIKAIMKKYGLNISDKDSFGIISRYSNNESLVFDFTQLQAIVTSLAQEDEP
jgi:Ca2+-binding EF-hand superfamily protein